MYRILSDSGEIFNNTNIEELLVVSAKQSEQLNQSGNLQFTLAQGHPLYGVLEAMSSYVTSYDDDELIFEGRIFECGRPTFSGQITYECEGALSYLMDSEVPPNRNAITMTVQEFFAWCISQHNADIDNDQRRTFTVGNVTVPDRAKSEKFQIASYTQTKTVIENNLINVYGGYLKIRHENGVRYLDWLEHYSDQVDPQQIIIGENVIEQSFSDNGENLFTVIRPVGKNGLLLDNPTINVFTSSEINNKYGRIVKSVNFSDATTKAALQTKANEYIARLKATLLCSGNIRLVDMHYLDGTSPKIKMGARFSNIQGLEGITMTVSGMERDYMEPYIDDCSFGNDKSLSDGTPNGGGSISRATSRAGSSVGMNYKHIIELGEQLEINADVLTMHGNTLNQHYEQITTTANQIITMSNDIDDMNSRLQTVEGTGVIQNDELLAQFAGTMRLRRNEQGIVTGIEFVDGTLVMDTDEEGHMVTVGAAIAANAGALQTIQGSGLWTQRDNITGVCGEFDIVEDPLTHVKTIVIKSGGGMKIREDNVEYGIYHKGNLTGGMIVDMLDDGTVRTTISGDIIDITSNSDYGTIATTVAGHTTSINSFSGSTLWTQRNAITGVCGEFDVVEDPNTHVKTLIVKSGGGMKIRRDNVEYGLYDDGNLTGGLIVDKLGDGTVQTTISGDIIDITTNSDYGTISTTVAEHTTSITTMGVSINSFEGSTLWTQRDDITGVCGEFDIVTDSTTGAKTLVVKSGGGIKIRRNNTEFGIYDSGNLSGGIVVDKINDGTTTTKIKGSRIVLGEDLTGDDLKSWAEDAEDGTGVFAKFLTVKRLTAQEIETLLANIGNADIGHLTVTGITGDTGYWDVDVDGIATFSSVHAGSYYVDEGSGTPVALRVADVAPSQSDPNILVITYTDGTTANFSKATTLSGSWSGLDFIVTASPQGAIKIGSVYDAIVPDTSQEGSAVYDPDTKTIKQYFYVYADDADGEGDAGSVILHKQISVNAADAYSAGFTDGSASGGSTTLTNTWSGGIFTVTASPQGVTLQRSLEQQAAVWSGNVVSIPIESKWGNSLQYSEGVVLSASVDVSSKLAAATLDGKNAVKVTGPTWTNQPASGITGNSNTATFTTDAPTPPSDAPKSLALYLVQGSWGTPSANKKYVYMHHTNSTEANRIARVEVDASSIYTNGQNAVKVTGPTWTNQPASGITGNSNTATFTTDAPTPSSNAPKSLALYMTQGSWSSNKKYVYVHHTNSTEANRIARVEVDASSIYTNGQNAVKVTGPTWATQPASGITGNSNTATFTTDAPTPSSNAPKSLALYMTQGSWSSNKKYVYVHHTNSTDANRIARVEVDASSIYTNGQNAVKVTGPTWATQPASNITGNSNTATFTTDAPTPSSNAPKSLALYMTQGSWSSNKKYVYVHHTDSTDAKRIARVQVDASSIYTNGQNAVKVTGPTWATQPASGITGNSNTATFTTDAPTPSSNAPKSLALYMTQGSWSSNKKYVYVHHTDSTDANRIARVQVDASSIYTNGKNAVKVTGPTWATQPSANITGNSNTATFTTDAPTPPNNAPKSLALYMTQGSWSSNKKYVYVHHTDSTDANRIARVQVDASSIYTNGRNAVKVTGPTWATQPSADITGNSNTATFTTDAPTPPSDAPKSLALYMTQGSWGTPSANKKYAYVHRTNSTDANRIARLEIDATARYRAGMQAVTASSAFSWRDGPASNVSVSDNVATISTSGRKDASGNTDEDTKTKSFYMAVGDWGTPSANKCYAYTMCGGTTGGYRIMRKEIDATPRIPNEFVYLSNQSTSGVINVRARRKVSDNDYRTIVDLGLNLTSYLRSGILGVGITDTPGSNHQGDLTSGKYIYIGAHGIYDTTKTWKVPDQNPAYSRSAQLYCSKIETGTTGVKTVTLTVQYSATQSVPFTAGNRYTMHW